LLPHHVRRPKLRPLCRPPRCTKRPCLGSPNSKRTLCVRQHRAGDTAKIAVEPRSPHTNSRWGSSKPGWTRTARPRANRPRRSRYARSSRASRRRFTRTARFQELRIIWARRRLQQEIAIVLIPLASMLGHTEIKWLQAYGEDDWLSEWFPFRYGFTRPHVGSESVFITCTGRQRIPKQRLLRTRKAKRQRRQRSGGRFASCHRQCLVV
jgi:hypothetical protein